ncbi:MAG: HPF/RaiA family ribosome-associated protein [Candidatus Babeliales bacterium]
MHKRITFRNMEKSEVLEQYAEKQLQKVVSFLENEPTPVYIDLVLEPSKTKEHHHIELRVKSPNYDEISDYEHQGTGFYDVLDRVIDIMVKKLHEAKRKRVSSRKIIARKEAFKKNS